MRLVIVLFVLTVAQQGRWKEVGTTSSSNPVYVDVRSIKRADGIVHATVRVVYQKPVKVGKSLMAASRSTAMFDCAKQTFAVKENVYYVDEKKNIVHSRSVNAKPGFGPAIKGSFADVALVQVCAMDKAPNAKP
ncbi:MAG: hypothetical protein MNPFHGCM_01173 [Gemmatimonadaceae bacterium]|nr:hypothetical protein [Gemmatimonadaceae bacterium]